MKSTERAAGNRFSGSLGPHVCFAAFVIVAGLLTLSLWRSLISYSLRDDSYSHILLIPLISVFLIVMDRKAVFREIRSSIGFSVVLIALGAFGFWRASRQSFSDNGRLFLSLASLAIVIILIGGFLLCYGRRATRAALFPLLFLLFMVPWPDLILAPTVSFLQEGSTDVACFIFRLVGVPNLRQGFVVSLPTVTIQVASECSSIRSSMALLITCVLAAHFALRTHWRTWLFAALVVPFSVIKNGIRIATLTLLGTCVDPSFLTGRLHNDGGFVFFFLALAMLWPLLRLLQRWESRGRRLSGDSTKAPAAGYAS